MDAEQGKSYPVDFLMSLELSEVPFHGLRLKVQVLVSVMGAKYRRSNDYD